MTRNFFGRSSTSSPAASAQLPNPKPEASLDDEDDDAEGQKTQHNNFFDTVSFPSSSISEAPTLKSNSNPPPTPPPPTPAEGSPAPTPALQPSSSSSDFLSRYGFQSRSPSPSSVQSDVNMRIDLGREESSSIISTSVASPTIATADTTAMSDISAKLSTLLDKTTALEKKQQADAATAMKTLRRLERKQRALSETVDGVYGVLSCVHDEIRPEGGGRGGGGGHGDGFLDNSGSGVDDDDDVELAKGSLNEKLANILDEVLDVGMMVDGLEEMMFGEGHRLMVKNVVEEVMDEIKMVEMADTIFEDVRKMGGI